MTPLKAIARDRTVTPPTKWRKSSYSGDTGNCVEVAVLPSNQIGIRDSKNPAGPMLQVSRQDWRAFTAKLRAIELA